MRPQQPCGLPGGKFGDCAPGRPNYYDIMKNFTATRQRYTKEKKYKMNRQVSDDDVGNEQKLTDENEKEALLRELFHYIIESTDEELEQIMSIMLAEKERSA